MEIAIKGRLCLKKRDTFSGFRNQELPFLFRGHFSNQNVNDHKEDLSVYLSQLLRKLSQAELSHLN